MQAVEERVPGDVSAAAFWLVAGAIHPDAELDIRDVGVNPTRRAVIDILRAMGADIEERPATVGPPPTTASASRSPTCASARRRSAAIELGPADVAAAIDEIPVLCLAAAVATGTTVIRGAGELRHKESDRIAGHGGGPARARRADRGRRRRPPHPRRDRRCTAPRPTASTTIAWR